jgi:hypothetical protein
MEVTNLAALTKELQRLFELHTSKRVGITRAPTQATGGDQVADMPYAIIYPLMLTDFWGPPLLAPEQNSSYDVQVTVVARRYDEAYWLQEKIRSVMVRRDNQGYFEVSLTVPNMVIQDRMIVDSSGPTPEGQLVNARETYRIKVGVQ